MEYLHLSFPTVVSASEDQEGMTSYRARPLLEGPGPDPLQGEGSSYHEALRNLKSNTRYVLSFFDPVLGPDRGDLARILTLGFSPPLGEWRIDLAFKSGGTFVEGPFTAVWFDLHGLRYVVLPGFDHHLFIAREDPGGRYDMRSEVERVVTHLLRQERLRSKADPPHPSTHFSPAREFLTEVGVGLWGLRSRFSFEPYWRPPLSDGWLEGWTALRETAKELNEGFPRELMRARFRESLVRRVGEALFGRTFRPLVLVGVAGAGKTAILHEALHRYLEERLRRYGDRGLETSRKVWELDPTRMVAGMSQVGMWQRRFEALLSYCRKPADSEVGILHVSNPVALLRVGKSDRSDFTLAAILKSHLERPQFPVILEASPGEWQRVQEMDRGFADLFEVIRVPELPEREAWEVTARARARLERQRNVLFDAGALLRLKDLLKPQGPSVPMPGGAIQFLERLSSRHRGGRVKSADVDHSFREQTGLREEMANPRVTLRCSEIEQTLGHRLVGQPEAIRCLVDTVAAIKTQLTDPERPYGAFLFVGPTGVGKTEAAKVLTEYLFGDSDRLLRFDMNEYVDRGSLARLIGGGHRPEGQLTSAVRFRPFSVLLLDEIEKAHPDVHDVLLQLLDDGRLTDGGGRTVDFTRTVIIMTSNVGSAEARATPGFDASRQDRGLVYRAAVKRHFRPELFNRIHRVVAFQPLGIDDACHVARLQIQRILQRDGFMRRGTVLRVSPGVLRRVVAEGFDPSLGGRSIKRALERSLAGLAAEKLISLPEDAPIVLEILLREGSLYPRVILLLMAGEGTLAFPFKPPVGREDRMAAWARLADVAVRLRDSLDSPPAPGNQGAAVETGSAHGGDIDALLLKDRLNDLLGELRDILDGPTRVPNKLVKPFRVRRAAVHGLNDGWYWRRHPNHGKPFAEMEVREYLQRVYEEAERAFQEGDAGILGAYQRLANLWLRHPLLPGKRCEGADPHGVCLHLRPLRDDSLEREERGAAFLCDCYRGVLSLVDPDLEGFLWDRTPQGEIYLGAVGRGLFAFCRGESGTHVFTEPSGGLLPVQVRVLSLRDESSFQEVVEKDQEARREWEVAFQDASVGEEEDPCPVGPVLRLYAPSDEYGGGSITDLRTGLAGEYKADPQTWFTWMHSALPPDLIPDLEGEP